jgi:hypothetical protein
LEGSDIPRRGAHASSDAASHPAPDPIISIVDLSESLLSRLFLSADHDYRHDRFPTHPQTNTMSAGQRMAYETAWLPMQKLLVGDHLSEFMRQYLMQSGEEVVKSAIYTALKNA